MQHSYDVIVVGSGPAGATVSAALARKGADVLVLEKERLPRYKCCAGGVTVRAAQMLDLDVRQLAEDAVTDMSVAFKGSQTYIGHSGEPIIYTVMRDKFDHALVTRAQQAGATIVDGQTVEHIQAFPDGVEVSTTSGSYRSRFLVGADGGYSTVAHQTGLRNGSRYVAAMESEVEAPPEELARWKSQIAIDIGCIYGGYAWVFPKHTHLSIGIASTSRKARGVRDSYRWFLDSLRLRNYRLRKTVAVAVPMCNWNVVAARGRIALLGDAAGLIDPLTGEGIRNAVWSARLAAPAIIEALQNGSTDLQGYQTAIEKQMLPEIRVSRVLARIFTLFPGRIFDALRRDERVWSACCRIIRNDLDLSTIKERLGGFRGIYSFLARQA